MLEGEYDMPASQDCLEHLHPLKDHLGRMRNVLKDDGHLFTVSTFRGDGLHISSNHKYNDLDEFNKLTAEVGFEFKSYLSSIFGLGGGKSAVANVYISAGRQSWGNNYPITKGLIQSPRPLNAFTVVVAVHREQS